MASQGTSRFRPVAEDSEENLDLNWEDLPEEPEEPEELEEPVAEEERRLKRRVHREFKWNEDEESVEEVNLPREDGVTESQGTAGVL